MLTTTAATITVHDPYATTTAALATTITTAEMLTTTAATITVHDPYATTTAALATTITTATTAEMLTTTAATITVHDPYATTTAVLATTITTATAAEMLTTTAATITVTTTTISPSKSTTAKVMQERKLTPSNYEISAPTILSDHELPVPTSPAEGSRSVFVILLLVTSALTMTASIALIVLTKFGVVLQEPPHAAAQRK
ncbi:unnamed protein product [Litomosoides sigmodontis]|uniref:Uncharacterized protein n=1 Tax=Litomosoides sigmodontis TaxID=42156 RepID=A0A3P6TBP9_LITSI|nr:unnamed protein product [Litomosoides sigmodontis]